jgi:hypothetical protein
MAHGLVGASVFGALADLFINSNKRTTSHDKYWTCARSLFMKLKQEDYAMRNYSGHAPGHIRDTFLEAVEAWYHWQEPEPQPTVTFEMNYQPRQISLAKACGLVWNCTDILPGGYVTMLLDWEVNLKSRTYASAARALRRSLN